MGWKLRSLLKERLLGPVDENTLILQKARKKLPKDTALHSRRLDSTDSTILQICLTAYVLLEDGPG
jgi:hypothetical protein